MTIAQIFDFKELTGKIFKLNDLLPHGRCKFFILRSRRAGRGYRCDPFRPQFGLYEAEIQVSCLGVETGSMSYRSMIMISSLAEYVKHEMSALSAFSS